MQQHVLCNIGMIDINIFIEYQRINFRLDIIAADFYRAIILMLHI